MKRPQKAWCEIAGKELVGTFHVYGRYYGMEHLNKVYLCRDVLELRRQGIPTASEQADAVFVMMNPGSSCPLVEQPDLLREDAQLAAAKPDTTQYQLMHLMNAFGWSFVRVINLSDLRTPKSSDLRRHLRAFGAAGIVCDHSIFADSRRRELERALQRNSGAPIVAAWGVHPELRIHAQAARMALDMHEVIGLKKPGFDWAYLHPLPRRHSLQVAWRQNMFDVIANRTRAFGK